MNPPDYYPVPAEVLDAARLSITKALASGNIDQKTTELLTNMLIGGEWPTNGIYKNFTKINKNIYLAILYFLPAAEEKRDKTPGPRHAESLNSALRFFQDYLDEPQNP